MQPPCDPYRHFFSRRSIGNQSAINRRPVGDRLAIGRRELSVEKLATSRRPVGDWLATCWRLIADWLEMCCDWSATGRRLFADGLATGWRSLKRSQPWGINTIQDCIRILSYYHTQHLLYEVKCRQAIGPIWLFAENSNALNNYIGSFVLQITHAFAHYKNNTIHVYLQGGSKRFMSS